MPRRQRTTHRPVAERVRRHRYLVAYWRANRLVLCNYVTGTTVPSRATDLAILEHASEWISLASLERFAAGRALPSSAVTRLLRSGALERMGRPLTGRERMAAEWHHWGPAATWFHQDTKNVTWATPEEAAHQNRRLFNPLAPVPEYPARGAGAPLLLENFQRSIPALTSTLLSRRTWRRFSGEPLQAAHLATLLGLTWGVQKWVRITGDQRLPLKTSPSGGSCHTLDCYVLALDVQGVPPGLYHYDADAHALTFVRTATRGDAERYFPARPAFSKCGAIFFMVAVFPRVQWKYRTGRAYRVVLLEAGHLGQTFCLAATGLGLAPFSTAAFADAALEADLGIDGITESVVYATGAGVRPADTDWAPFADGPTPDTEPPAWARRP